jgi:hypothetical protein
MSREHRIALVVGSFHKHDCEVMVAAARRAAESLGLPIRSGGMGSRIVRKAAGGEAIASP